VRDVDYEQWVLRTYKYWKLYLKFDDQRYLGRSYAWLIRDTGPQSLPDIAIEEWLELRRIIKQYQRVVGELWHPNLINYAWLCNEVDVHGGHGHMHFIPRYKTPRQFGERIFPDHNWGKNYTPHEPFKLSEHELIALRDYLKRYLRIGTV
jgi:diadenosine tetraphosphate (Ap4A) HIT family hydrolase